MNFLMFILSFYSFDIFVIEVIILGLRSDNIFIPGLWSTKTKLYEYTHIRT